MGTIDTAYLLAEAALAPHLPDRWQHVRGVASLALKLGNKLPEVDSDVLVQAAWLHDVGYSPVAVASGFHPLDGARYLWSQGITYRVVSLVANHSAARVEARLRGLRLIELYPDEMTDTRDALWYCDANTSPSGEHCDPSVRWAEVRQRYGSGHVVTQFLDEAAPDLDGAVRRIDELLDLHESLEQPIDL